MSVYITHQRPDPFWVRDSSSSSANARLRSQWLFSTQVHQNRHAAALNFSRVFGCMFNKLISFSLINLHHIYIPLLSMFCSSLVVRKAYLSLWGACDHEIFEHCRAASSGKNQSVFVTWVIIMARFGNPAPRFVDYLVTFSESYQIYVAN